MVTKPSGGLNGGSEGSNVNRIMPSTGEIAGKKITKGFEIPQSETIGDVVETVISQPGLEKIPSQEGIPKNKSESSTELPKAQVDRIQRNVLLAQAKLSELENALQGIGNPSLAQKLAKLGEGFSGMLALLAEVERELPENAAQPKTDTPTNVAAKLPSEPTVEVEARTSKAKERPEDIVGVRKISSEIADALAFIKKCKSKNTSMEDEAFAEIIKKFSILLSVNGREGLNIISNHLLEILNTLDEGLVNNVDNSEGFIDYLENYIDSTQDLDPQLKGKLDELHKLCDNMQKARLMSWGDED